VRRWRKLVIDRENGRILFDRPKPAAGCSASGGRKRSRWKTLEKIVCFMLPLNLS
jgi:hypothetical protein